MTLFLGGKQRVPVLIFFLDLFQDNYVICFTLFALSANQR